MSGVEIALKSALGISLKGVNRWLERSQKGAEFAERSGASCGENR